MRSGKRSVINGVRANRIYEIDEAEAIEVQSSKFKVQSSREAPITNPQSPVTVHESRITNHESRLSNSPPVYEDVSQLLQHSHHEEEFNDFDRQPLLPRKLSQLGPGVGWYDVDGDGREDLIIGSGRGGKLAVYRDEGTGGFKRWSEEQFEKVMPRDQTAVLGTEFGLLVGSANYEDGQTNGGCVRIYDTRRKVSGESVLGQRFSVGPLALADVDGDGDLDLFVGGRVVAGRYPEPADSLLLRNEGGRLMLYQRLEKVGLVSGAVFSDLDSDGKPDLVLACEWGPVRIFRNERGKLVSWDAPLIINDQQSTFNQLTGWWTGVATGDFDGDGRMDIVANNWGLNTQYRTSREHPRKLHYGDLGGTGAVDLIETSYDEPMQAEVPERGLRAVSAALPWVKEKYSTFEAYGQASAAEIYGDKFKSMGVVEVNTLQSMVFLNRGDHFEAKPLPAEAQLAPAYAACVGDYDGDGNEDVFLSQNFFAVNPDSSRCDAGRGLWLQGDGRGNLIAVSGQESGVKVYGEQRGAALCDYDGDGRVDFVVTQNGADTKLYHNVGARPGLRVRLKGPAGNPRGIGAQLRLMFGPRPGPVRELHAGSGYWSEDSAVAVLGNPEAPTAIQIRWPNGPTATIPIPSHAKEIVVDISGSVLVVK